MDGPAFALDFHPPAALRTARLALRRWRPAHAPALGAALAASDAHLRAWTPWVLDDAGSPAALDARIARFAAAFDAGTEWRWALQPHEGDAILGEVGLYPRAGPHALDVGYWLAADATGRGLATEATGAIVALALAVPGLTHLTLHSEAGNAASAGVARRLGFTAAGTMLAPARVPDRGPATLTVWRLDRSPGAV